MPKTKACLSNISRSTCHIIPKLGVRIGLCLWNSLWILSTTLHNTGLDYLWGKIALCFTFVIFPEMDWLAGHLCFQSCQSQLFL